VELNRRILEHWPKLSSNGAKLLIWLAAKAKRGEAKIALEDLADAWDWSKSTVRRTLKELAVKNLISVTPAANQHEITVIKILDSAVSKNERTSEPSAVLISEQSNPQDSALAGVLTDEYSADDPALLTNQQSNNEPAVFKDEQSKPSNCLETKEQLAERIAAKIAASGGLAGELTDSQHKALEYLSFQCDPRYLSFGFVAIAGLLYGRADGNLPSPGRFASRLIYECLEEQKAAVAEGKPPARFYFPPMFERWSGMLRDWEWCAAKDREWCAEQAAVAV